MVPWEYMLYMSGLSGPSGSMPEIPVCHHDKKVLIMRYAILFTGEPDVIYPVRSNG
jgi:hypothetical protein